MVCARSAREAWLIETFVVLAEYLPGEDAYEITANFQGPLAMHPVMALALGVPANRLRLRTPPDSGGSFGAKHAVFPHIVLMALAALQMVPAAPVEAARIDGANDWQTFRYVIFPYIQQTMLVAGVFRLIDSIKAFPLIFVLTDGGPGDVTEVTNYYAYRQAFTFSLWGYGSAIATLMVIGIFVLSWAIDRLTRAADAEAG